VRARPLNIYFFEVVIIMGLTVVIGQTTLHLFFRGCNIFGRDERGHNNFEGDKGKRARPLNIYFFEVIIILGVMDEVIIILVA
jgi:hypothetical protein